MAENAPIARLARRGLLVAAGLVLAAPAVLAQPRLAPLPAPAGRGILRIGGRISVTNEPETAVFDRPMLEDLGVVSITTATPWYDGPQTFEGPLMTRLLERVGAQGETITAVALNDYSTEIPISDFGRFGTILALKRGGEYMPVRDKGPLFIVYPYDSNPELKSPRYYGRSAWQVARLTVK